MSFLGLFKKEAANKAQASQQRPEIVTSTPTNNNQTSAPTADPFGGFVKFKGQQPPSSNPFGTNSPSTVASANQPPSGSLYGAASQVKIDYSGLSPINPVSNTFLSDGDSFGVDSQGDNNTPGGTNPAFKESPVKKSAFGFLNGKKGPAANRTEGNEGEQQDSNAGGETNYANDLLGLDFNKKPQSVNEVNTKSQPSTGGFPLTFKTKQPFGKPAEQEQATDFKRRPSIDFNDDTKRKPSLAMETNSQNEIGAEKPESNPKIESQNEQPAPKKVGPAFKKFKQTSAPKQEEVKQTKQQTPKHEDKFTDEEHAAIHQREESPKLDKSPQLSRPIPIPAVSSQEDPSSLQARLEAEKGAIMEKIGNLILKQSKIIANKESFEAQKEQLLNKVKDLGKQQNRAIEKDNFEEADRLEALIVQTNQKIKSVDQEIDNCQLQHASLEKEKGALYQQNLTIYRNFFVNVEKATLSRNHAFEKYKLDCLNQQNTEKLYIEEESQRLQLHRNHLDLDLKHIEEESDALEKNIEKQTKEYVQNQRDFSARKIGLELEIEQIKKELAAKEAELISVTGSLEKYTNKINGVRAKFSDHLQRVQTKKDKSDREEAQYAKELDRLNQTKSNAENNTRIYNETMGGHQKNMQLYEDLKNTLQTESHSLREENTERENALQVYYNSLNKLKETKNLLAERTSEIEELKDGLDKTQKEIVDINTNKSTLEAKIPELEAEKKGYINSRSFKDASRISNDIKDIQTKIQELDQRLNELTSKDKLQLQKISSLEKNIIPQLLSKVESASRACDLDKYHFLQTRERDLCSAHDYFSRRNQSKEANMVENELTEVQSQLSYLKNQYPELAGGNHEEHHEEAHYDHQEHHQPEYQHDQEEEQADHQEGYYQQEEEHQHHEEVPYKNEEQELGLAESVAQYDELTHKINEMDSLIDQYAMEEKYEEADEVASQQAEMRQRQEALLQNIQHLGYNSIEDARAAAGEY